MPHKSRPTADDLALRADVLLLHAEAARIAEARRTTREAKRAAPAEDVRIEKRRERQSEARARKERWETTPASALPRHCPQRRAPTGRWQDHYSDAEFERQFGYEKPAPGDDDIPF